jgi:hypothetical protein
MLLKIAYRNLLARPLRTLAVGSIIAFGAFLAVLGGSFVDSMTGSLRRSLTRSVVGDLQVYSDHGLDRRWGGVGVRGGVHHHGTERCYLRPLGLH